ncbi:hypothetical protein CK203_097324 [Vitis vinifera]|uniref:Methyltransferase type 11 domain-containing protein n=1 Tax=Vitis vinifera TaxID=29760 RepID=A0A438D683_VITVI|nr:hypothetical protein CK203_097324 [Vitis vinifera]
MDSSQKLKPFSTNVFFLVVLFSTNFLTFLFSSSLYSSCSITPSTTHVAAVDDPVSDNVINSQTTTDLPTEFISFTSPQLLPFGFTTNFDSDSIIAPVGHPCTFFANDLSRYMSYRVNGSCPDDELFAQKLLLKGCEPLPAAAAAPPLRMNIKNHIPFLLAYGPLHPTHLWCGQPTQGTERYRWIGSKSGHNELDFTIDEVLEMKKRGTVRIGLDIGGGAGTFAVRMLERNITIVTTSMNLNGPFNSFIASRGVVPLYISISQRLPFFDNTLDIVHSMHVLSNWIPNTLLHFLLFDIYRVLRPGGLFWLDHFFCMDEQMEEVYKPLIESVGFKKLKWVVGKKLDRGPKLREMYLSALLEKPLRNHG